MHRWYVVPLASIALLLGCGGDGLPKGVIVTGKILKGGKPLEVPSAPGTGVRISLVPVGPVDERSNVGGTAGPDGSFEIVDTGKGIPPGKYQVTVFQIVEVNDQEMTSKDALAGAFDATNSGLEVEIPSDKVGGKFDLGTIDIDTAPKKSPDAK